MVVKVFVLGRPGSGKTTIVNHLLNQAKEMGIPTLRMKDYNILYDMFINESQSKSRGMSRKFRPTEFGGFDVLDYSVFDTALEILENQVEEESDKTLTSRKLITIEFARNDYQVALSKFTPAFLQDSYFFFIDADMSICMQRIYRRLTNPPMPDHHFVSDYIMDVYYSRESWNYMSQGFQKEYGLDSERIAAYRNIGSLEDLYAQTSNFAEMIFSREFATVPTVVPLMHSHGFDHVSFWGGY